VAFGVMTLEIDQLVMIYRDVETMARFPLEIYGKNFELFSYLYHSFGYNDCFSR